MNLRRRHLLAFFSGALAVLPFATVNAQQPATPFHRIGILAQELQPGLMETFRNELQKLGYVEGTNISIELRDAAGQNERLAALAEELLRLRVEVIVAINTPAAQSRQKSHPDRPHRHDASRRSREVGTCDQPCQTEAGTSPGLSFMPDALGPKGVEILHQILPEITRMAALYRGDNPGAVVIVDEVIRKAEPLGLKFVRTPVQSGLAGHRKSLRPRRQCQVTGDFRHG